jgi:hypothetical protein
MDWVALLAAGFGRSRARQRRIQDCHAQGRNGKALFREGLEPQGYVDTP